MDYKEYWDDRSSRWQFEYTDTLDLWKELEPLIDPTWKVLEVGSGDGRWSDYIHNYVGMDVSPKLIAIARKAHPGKIFICRDMMKGALLGFDLVFFFTSLMALTKEDFKKFNLPETRIIAVEPHSADSDHAHSHNYASKGLRKYKVIDDRTIWTNFL